MKSILKSIKDYTRPHFLLLILSTFTFISACQKFVQIAPPQTQLVTTSVFANDATASAALTSIYNQMNSNSESINTSVNAGLSGDELTNYATATNIIPYYTNSLNTGFQYGSWGNAYKYIYQANAIIIGLQQNKGVSPAVNQQLTGEAKFLRAFWHLYLTNFYGDVPIVLTTDYTLINQLSRTPRIQVLQQVIADLTDAQNALAANYVNASDTITTIERVQPNKAAATALLSRAYLYLGDYSSHDVTQYANAEAQASAVIANSLYSLSPLTGLASVFKKNSTETIWSLQTNLPASNYATPDGQRYILISAPSGNLVSNAISPQLLNSFEAGDQRKVNWIGAYSTTTLPVVTYNFSYKYRDQNVTAASEYSVVLRLAEQYLIRAEAEAQEGKTIPAISDLNIIRNRAGLANYAGATDKTSLLAAILHERQVEFFTEWGHRWLDLARTGTINSVMGSPGNVYQFKGGLGTWNPNWQLYPIPQGDIILNPNLTQNAGY